MKVELFNFWYFFWLVICFGFFFILYFILRNRSNKTKKIVLFIILFSALVLHFLKMLFPPYINNNIRLYNDSWFINICAANILIFPFIFISKSNKAKDYMFFIGIISGLLAIFYPVEPLEKANPTEEWLDVIRFYIHHMILWQVPLLMVVLKLHKVSYKSSLIVPTGLLLLMLFIMLNQILQSELGFIGLRGNDFYKIPYKNTSLIWGPTDDGLGRFFDIFCPQFFKTVPVGVNAGTPKYWPWFWLIFPCYILLTPLSFAISLIFDWQNLKKDIFFISHYKQNKIQ